MIFTATDAGVISHIGHLVSSFGVSASISDETLAKLRIMYEEGQSSKCIAEIKSFLNLGLTIKIGYLNKKPTNIDLAKLIIKNAPPTESYRLSSQSQDTLEHIQDAIDNSAAFLVRPSRIPLYGTHRFNDFKILIFIFKWFINYSFERFIYCIAHELTHIVLDSTIHPLRNSEVATDLAAMIFGFSDVIKIGRKAEGSICGYLDDHQFQIAYREIHKRSQIIYL